jgi:hypothetical protein
MRKIAPLKKENNRACWAAWRILVKSWKLFKRDIANSNLNWLYIQTGQDYLLDKIQWKKINRKTKDKTKLIWNDYGYHMLAFEENAIKDIYKIIEEKLIRNNS